MNEKDKLNLTSTELFKKVEEVEANLHELFGFSKERQKEFEKLYALTDSKGNSTPKEQFKAGAKAQREAQTELIDALIAINESKEARKAMGSIARGKMIYALKKAGVEL